MTQTEKARAYDEALERARKLKENPQSVFNEYSPKEGDTICDYIFPELKESEDERIRKALIHLVNSNKELSFGIDNYDGIKWSDILTWLEKQGEQKPIEEVNGEDYGIDGLWHAQRILEETIGSVDGYQTDDGILDHKAAITAVKKLYKQKPAWSEEDEKMFRNLNSLIYVVRDSDCDSKEKLKLSVWLKSLKERRSWSPSDEQITVLELASKYERVFTSKQIDILIDLKEQLKKLKGE